MISQQTRCDLSKDIVEIDSLLAYSGWFRAKNRLCKVANYPKGSRKDKKCQFDIILILK